MQTSAQDSVVSARTLQRHGHTVSVINDGKFLMNFRAQPLYKSMVMSELWVWFIGAVSGFCPLHTEAKVLGCAKFQSVVRSMEVARFLEVAFTLSLCKLQSVPQGLSTVERQSASQRVRYGRLHCIEQIVARSSFRDIDM